MKYLPKEIDRQEIGENYIDNLTAEEDLEKYQRNDNYSASTFTMNRNYK